MARQPQRKGSAQDVRPMFIAAHSSWMAQDKILKSLPDTNNVYNPAVPAAVCLGLAAELYLKLLALISKGSYLTDHDLGRLFADLPPDMQAYMTTELAPLDVAKALQDHGSPFVNWRYYWDGPGLRLGKEIGNVIDCCQAYLYKNHKTQII